MSYLTLLGRSSRWDNVLFICPFFVGRAVNEYGGLPAPKIHSSTQMTLMNGNPPIPSPVNEPILTYAPGTLERAELKTELEAQSTTVVDLSLIHI